MSRTPQKITIVGAGAVGGFIGAMLARSGQHAVSALARGATLQALRTQGWRVQGADGAWQAPLAQASDMAADLGPQDLVVIAVKAPALPPLAPHLRALIGPHTLVLPAMNGVPWWFCSHLPGWAGRHLRHVDPLGHTADALPLPQVLGCVVHLSCAAPQPGLVQHLRGQGLIVGEPAGGVSARSQALAETLREAGFDTTLSADVRQDVWYKLWGNLTMNPISALTGATVDRVLDDPELRAFCTRAMEEARALGERIGCPIAQTAQDRHAVTRKLGAFKTSMLQDVEAGRAIELDAIVGAVVEIARHEQLPTPAIDSLLGLTRLMAQVRGLYPSTT
jgi:2-dehydropantoate 2-reductase